MKTIISLIFLLPLSCSAPMQTPTSAIKQAENPGKQITFSRDKGNCLACHEIEDGESPGNIGPALKNLPSRFNNKKQLRDQIWDATRFNPETSMPPFGKNKIISEIEIDQVVDYLWGIK
ncbi:MAG: sulfur oxidation c-type cytochrome SoxX [Methyloglobulus sp.]|nr:sulfur oxidation c-type cytochrome SoxX [Methyloglobulus sp.]